MASLALSACSSSDAPGASAGDGAVAGNGGSSGGNGGQAQGNGGRAQANGGSSASGGSTVMGTTSAKAVAQKLGRDHFLIGMGNDLDPDHDKDGAYTLGVTLDLHYAYLVGLIDRNPSGWPDWNAGGTFVNILADSAKAHGVVPMYTLYSMAADGEANASTLTDDEYMRRYWDGAKLLFERIAAFGDPAVVQFEPDFWGFMQRQNGDPSAVTVHVTSLAPDCANLPNTLVGMGKCLVALGRKYAPKAVIGFHVSAWGADDAAQLVSYFKAIGAGEGDIVTTDTLDRDAGCFEAGNDSNCTRGTTGFYWDESNTTSPNFREHLDWVKSITTGVGKPMLWWQTPFGVPSDTPGGTPGHYRDNRVHYIFNHIDEFVAAGGVGAVFGTGAGNQTYITTDGDQFKNAVTSYFASPVAL